MAHFGTGRADAMLLPLGNNFVPGVSRFSNPLVLANCGLNYNRAHASDSLGLSLRGERPRAGLGIDVQRAVVG